MRRSLTFPAGLALALISLTGGIGPLQADPPAKVSDTPTLNPQVASLLKQAEAAYQKLNSYQHTEVLKVEAAGSKASPAGKFMLALERPNKFCFRQPGGDGMTTIVSDGKNLFKYRDRTLEYIRVAAPDSFKDMTIVDEEALLSPASSLVVLMLQGGPVAEKKLAEFLAHFIPGDDVTEGKRKYQTLSDSEGELTTRLYFDATTHLFTRWSNTDKQHGLTATETLQDVALNKPIKPSVFQYAPPLGATQVEKFTPTGP